MPGAAQASVDPGPGGGAGPNVTSLSVAKLYPADPQVAPDSTVSYTLSISMQRISTGQVSCQNFGFQSRFRHLLSLTNQFIL